MPSETTLPQDREPSDAPKEADIQRFLGKAYSAGLDAAAEAAEGNLSEAYNAAMRIGNGTLSS